MPGCHDRMRGRARITVSCAVALLVFGWTSSGALASDEVPTLRGGAIEIGASGLLTTVEGITTGSLVVRAGRFMNAPYGLAAIEVGIGYDHISSLDQFDLEAALSWQRRVGEAGNYPFVSVAGGLRHEEIGSFGQTRYPLGFGLGWRTLLGSRVALRMQYDFRRVLNDPIEDVSEYNVTFGISVFFKNKPEVRKGE